MGVLNYDTRHKLRDHDFDILDKFEFKYAPVGFKFFNVEADLKGLELDQLDAEIAWCQMLLEAQKGKAFYATAENQWEIVNNYNTVRINGYMKLIPNVSRLVFSLWIVPERGLPVRICEFRPR